MCEMYGIIEDLCTKKGIKVGKMCTILGISRGVMGDLKAGRTKKLSAESLSKIAAYFGVTTDYMFGKETKESPDEVSEDELPHAQYREIACGAFKIMFDVRNPNVTEEGLKLLIDTANMVQRKERQ